MTLCAVALLLPLALSGDNTHPMAEIFEGMRLAPGSRVADIGAGAAGSAVFPMARIVGPTGRVWAVDIDEKRAIPQLNARVEKERIKNVEVTVGAPDDPRLPAGSLDAVLIMNAYHEMNRHREILSRVRESLKPGGRLVIADHIPGPTQGKTRAEQATHHVLAPEFVEDELKAAGFRVVSRRERITVEGYDPLWMLVAEPADASQL